MRGVHILLSDEKALEAKEIRKMLMNKSMCSHHFVVSKKKNHQQLKRLTQLGSRQAQNQYFQKQDAQTPIPLGKFSFNRLNTSYTYSTTQLTNLIFYSDFISFEIRLYQIF